MGLPEIILEGTAFERGLTYGKRFGKEIRAFLADDFARVNLLRNQQLTEAKIRTLCEMYGAVTLEEIPSIYEEIKGLAKGAEIELYEAILLQYRREIINYQEPASDAEDCSTIAQLGGSPSFIGQTIDLNGNMANLGTMLRIKGDKNCPEILMYTFMGLLGYLGMNDRGLAIGINMVLSKDWQVGISPYLLVRKLLEFSSVEACLGQIKTLCRSSSRSLTIMDRESLVNVEMTANKVKVTESDSVLHTNHYLNPAIVSEDCINIFSKNSSIKRLEFMKDFLSKNEGMVAPTALFDMFSSHFLYPVGICAHAEGNIKRSETVASVVMLPREGRFYARKGYACEGITKEFLLGTVPCGTSI